MGKKGERELSELAKLVKQRLQIDGPHSPDFEICKKCHLIQKNLGPISKCTKIFPQLPILHIQRSIEQMQESWPLWTKSIKKLQACSVFTNPFLPCFLCPTGKSFQLKRKGIDHSADAPERVFYAKEKLSLETRISWAVFGHGSENKNSIKKLTFQPILGSILK
jgi:hypothetical protein